VSSLAVDHLNAEGAAALFTDATRTLVEDPLRRGCCVHLPPRGRMLATGDLHDHPIHFQKVRAFARLDRADHHVVLHELIHGERLTHGADLSWRMLAKVAALRLAHPGQVHPMLANHEIAQAFLQPVSKGAGECTRLFRDGLEWSFGDDCAIVEDAVNAFIRAMPLAVRAANGLMCSHSLPSPMAMRGFDRGVLERALDEADFAPRTGAAWNMTWGRGQTEELVRELAEAWGVSLFVAGHKHVEQGAETPFPRLVLLNSDHERAAVIPFDLAAPAPIAGAAVAAAVPLGMIEVEGV
jgi:hypothetical protein